MLRVALVLTIALAGCSPAEPPLMIDPSDQPAASAEAVPLDRATKPAQQ